MFLIQFVNTVWGYNMEGYGWIPVYLYAMGLQRAQQLSDFIQHAAQPN